MAFKPRHLSLEQRHTVPAHAPLAVHDGKRAGNVVQMGVQEEEKMDLVTITQPCYNRTEPRLAGRGEGCLGSAGISPGWERTSPGVSKLKLGLIPVDWLMAGREGHVWLYSHGPWK